MRSKVALLLASVSVAAMIVASAGCKKTSPESGGGATDNADAQLGARDYFVAKVFPQVSRGCAACHGAGGTASSFLATSAEQSYQLITNSLGLIAEPAKSPLVQHVHTKDPTVVLSPEQRTVLTQWLNMEATARGLAGSVKKAPTLQAAYKAYADCMNFDMWSYYRVGDLPFSQTDIDGPCMGCHSIGQGSAWLSAGSRETFEKAKEFPFIQKFVVGKVDSNGNFDTLVPAGRFVDKADEPCPAGKTDCHPSFGVPPNVAAALDNFVIGTLQNVAAGTCNQPFVIPRDAGAVTADGGK